MACTSNIMTRLYKVKNALCPLRPSRGWAISVILCGLIALLGVGGVKIVRAEEAGPAETLAKLLAQGDMAMKMKLARFAALALTLALAGGLFAGSAVPSYAEKIKNDIAVFTGLDKITGRIFSFEVYIDETERRTWFLFEATRAADASGH